MTATKVTSGQVVSMQYTLRVDGKVVDSSEEGDPLEYLYGAANIIPGLEREMEGMAVGESRTVIVSPLDGYGEVDEEAFIEAPRSEFPDDMPIKPGVEMELTGPDGHPMYARIERVEGETVTLNMNHPLAGAELHFDVKVVGLRDATEEEMDHGHAHGALQH
ncbi:MAG: peptidyl-prolyl cis-trans isomerase [Anaerolineaceae bacterium]|nr:peptidylprolyl isomerase [Anaerolineae bacterium]MBL1172041.1 peptidylprolyl isomerase [Chloroflexota bacterium]MDL1926905.1 peptidylprolyl isomerase [Anaerolineae bacterium AMX1]WKZ54654.1 MAG: peptidylprolyl isomerase [Anaerolineales bacterium]GJQ38552.1 MAG: peptidyl-prolyl cis-trans isomerase [Anaerolineaceae bacterium]